MIARAWRWLKWPAAFIGLIVWLWGLAHQVNDPRHIANYLLISLLMLAIAGLINGVEKRP